jgi:ppGpp synthetase/RelA/SpoT-type nucleotidyltranferase
LLLYKISAQNPNVLKVKTLPPHDVMALAHNKSVKPLKSRIAIMMSKSKIDELGERLRQAATDEVALDVVALDAYRESFSDAINGVQKMLRAANLTEFTSRTKSTASVVAKLLRQPNTRLSQVQDILGLRFVTNDLKQQEVLMVELTRIFSDAKRKTADFPHSTATAPCI